MECQSMKSFRQIVQFAFLYPPPRKGHGASGMEVLLDGDGYSLPPPPPRSILRFDIDGSVKM